MIEDLKSKLNQKIKDQNIHNKIIEESVFDILDLFTYKNFEVKYDYKSGQELVLITYELPKYLKGFSEITYRITYAAEELRISLDNNYHIKMLNIEENEKNINDYYNFIIELNKFVFNIDRKFIIHSMIEIKSNQKKVNKINKEIKNLNEEITIIENNKEFNVIEKVLPSFNNFCIDSFLCDQYNINYKDTPTKEDISELKKSIKKGSEKTFSFLVKLLNNNSITFKEIYLIVKNNGTLYIKGGERTKKGINETLSKQFFVNGILANKNNFDKSKLFYTLFPKALDKENHFYYSFQGGWGLTLNIEQMKERLNKLALQKDLEIF